MERIPMGKKPNGPAGGRYVALKSFKDPTIVGSGQDPVTALKESMAKGISDPILIFIPGKQITVS